MATTTRARSRSALIGSCSGRFHRVSIRSLSCRRGWGFGGLTVSRNFSRDGSNKDVASLNLELVTPLVITPTALRNGRNVWRGRVLGANRLVDTKEVLNLCMLRNNGLGLRS